ncbi:MAG: hypothetical protein JWM80_1779 [Cyanobacteria bacterium RYN_339]|nr:hypothetical protein [Cyanobacteria bacterium RYN_339]
MSRSLAPWTVAALLVAGCASTKPLAVLATSSAAPVTAAATATPAPTPTGPQTTGATTLDGESKALFGGTVVTWAKTDATNVIGEVGVTVPAAVIDGAPTDAAAKAGGVDLLLPERVRKETFLTHVDVGWNPTGHDPAPIYGLPHFDFHFYNLNALDVAAIDCKDTTTVPAARIPAGFALLPPPNGICVPMMGIHASDLTSPELAQTNPAKFTKTMILGYYKGSMTFIEPMFTKEFLQTKAAFTLNVPAPGELGKATLLPGSFAGSYDDKTKAYTFVFKGFKAAK